MKFKDFMVIWLENLKIAVKPKTYIRYVEIATKNILPFFGDKSIEKIDKGTIRNFYCHMKQNYSDNTLLQVFGLLRRSLKSAVRKGIISSDPSADIVLSHHQKNIFPFSEREQHILIEFIIEAKKPQYYGILIALYTGLRLGELLALTWEDIDMKNNYINVSKNHCSIKVSDGENPFLSTPKTEKSIRIIPYPKHLNKFLKDMKSLGNKYVVSTRNGNFMRVFGYQKMFSGLLMRLDIKHRGFHCLRHTYATNAIELGVDIKTLSEMLGHSTPAVTINRYCHTTDKQKRKVSEKFNEKLKKYIY